MKYTEATAKEHFKRLYEMKGTISMMSVSLDTIKTKQTSIYNSSFVLLSCLYISTSLFFLLLPYSDAACCLKYPRHSLCLALPHKKHTKPQAQEYKYILIQTHTHTHTDDMPQFLLSLLLSFILCSPIPIIPSLFLFPPLVECKNGCLGRRQLESDSYRNGGRQARRERWRERERERGMRGIVCRAQ